MLELRVLGYRLVAPDQLLAHPLNPRRHSGTQREAIRDSLATLGWIAPVLNNVRTGHVLDGHARVEEALSAGVSLIPVCDIDLSESDELIALATYDPLTGLAGYDPAATKALLAIVEQQDTPAGLKPLLGALSQYRPLEAYLPTLPPERPISQAVVTEAQVAAQATALAHYYEWPTPLTSHTCPNCGATFYLSGDA